jgi:hypothetical protein
LCDTRKSFRRCRVKTQDHPTPIGSSAAMVISEGRNPNLRPQLSQRKFSKKSG